MSSEEQKLLSADTKSYPQMLYDLSVSKNLSDIQVDYLHQVAIRLKHRDVNKIRSRLEFCLELLEGKTWP